MGLFFESKKEKEAKENRALESVLSAFEENLKNTENTDKRQNNSPVEQVEVNESIPFQAAKVKDLVEFLCLQKIIKKNEWEDYVKGLGLK